MYDIIKNVILSKDFELTSMLQKIDTMWIQNEITDDQKNELKILARENADMTMTLDLVDMVKKLDERVTVLEQGKATEPAPEYPAFEVGKIYHNGDKVSFEGKQYKCIVPSYTQCVWSPSDYPDYWKQIA